MDKHQLSRILMYASGLLAIAAIVLLVLTLLNRTENRALLPWGLACSALSATLSQIQRRIRKE